VDLFVTQVSSDLQKDVRFQRQTWLLEERRGAAQSRVSHDGNFAPPLVFMWTSGLGAGKHLGGKCSQRCEHEATIPTY
jgi:hypothetical protein